MINIHIISLNDHLTALKYWSLPREAAAGAVRLGFWTVGSANITECLEHAAGWAVFSLGAGSEALEGFASLDNHKMAEEDEKMQQSRFRVQHGFKKWLKVWSNESSTVQNLSDKQKNKSVLCFSG